MPDIQIEDFQSNVPSNLTQARRNFTKGGGHTKQIQNMVKVEHFLLDGKLCSDLHSADSTVLKGRQAGMGYSRPGVEVPITRRDAGSQQIGFLLGSLPPVRL